MVTMAVALMVLDRSFVYEQGTLEVTGRWSLVGIALGIVGAILGGFVTAVIAPSPRRTPVKVLAGILLVLGLAIAVLHVFVDDPTATCSRRPRSPSPPPGTTSPFPWWAASECSSAGG
jgi:drug/metabolite transporter (DMT)-like permease